jgi:hypothetical protein
MLHIVLNSEELRTSLGEVLKKIAEEYADSKVLIYYSKNSSIPVLSVDAVRNLFAMRMEPSFIACPGCEDALVMEIASDIGYRLGANSDDMTFKIISNDGHYTHLANFWNSQDETERVSHAHINAFIGPVLGMKKPKESKESSSCIPEDPWLEDAERRLATGY